FEYSVTDEAGNQSNPVTVEIGALETSTDVPDAFVVPPEITGLSATDDITVDEAFLENGTRAGDSSDGATASGQFTLNASAGVGTLSIAAAGLVSGGAGFADGRVTLTADQLLATNDTDVVIETSEGNTLRLTGFDAGTGKVDYQFELNQPVINSNGEPLDKASISLELIDSNGTSAQAELNVTILDDGVDATNDLIADTTSDGDATGNVLGNDLGADGGLKVTSVTFAGTSYSLPEDGSEKSIQGDHGVLSIGRDGEYHYEANSIDPVTIGGDSLTAWQDQTKGLWGFTSTSSTPLAQDGNLLVGDLGDGNDAVVFNNGSKSGLGVPDGAGKIDDGESLLIHLNGPTNSASVGINQFNYSQSELGLWNAYAENGVLVGRGTFGGVNSNGVRFDLSIETDASFTYLELGLDTGGINSNTGFVIDEVTSTPSQQFEQDHFTYTVEDQDGSTAEGTLTAHALSDDLNPVMGTAGDDTVTGTGDDDGLAGGAGDDVLIGGAGDDVFQWSLADKGETDKPANDVVKDFGDGNDVLDLRDLLVGETEQSISQFLSVSEDGDDLVLQVTHDGDDGGPTQSIRLEGKSFSDFGAQDGPETIQKMIDNGQLNIDS
ncbi:MAG: type I secretion C-terminal target domain-containing protein, partial [Marinobacter sp.]|nr:type I secretion C-terminal target domain-containing protein [Marinobacter sp.]